MNTETKNKWLKAFGNNSLHIIIFVTEQCNFRCVYCYEDFKLGKIEIDIVEGIKKLIEKRIGDIKILQLSFFGGEPLMNKETVLDISSWASELCRQNSVIYVANITTNGYSLSENTFEKLIESGVSSYQITLDGEREAHNKLRPTVSGKPTFDKILSNLIMMSKSDFKFFVTFRFNVADINFLSVKAFLTEYFPYFANDERFTFHFHPIFGMQDLRLANNSVEELQNLASSYGLMKHEEDNQARICYAARGDSFVIRADGKVQKCTVALNDEINNIGIITSDGELKLDTEKLKRWVFAEDKGCPLQTLALENLAQPYSGAGKYTKYA